MHVLLNQYKTIVFLLLSSIAYTQSITVDTNKTPTELVQSLFSIGSCVQPTNISIRGWDFGNGEKSYGFFDRNTSDFPLDDGVIISTGRANAAIGPNTSLLSEGPNNWAGDSELEQIIGENNSINATIIEFDFISVTNYISFNYIFASEQYLSNPSQNQCNYSDGFAFLLRENTPTSYQNLAVIPGTSIPVKVTTVRGPGTVCPAANPQYFDTFNGSNHPTNFNGQTKVMNAEANIRPGISYHVKLVIADQGNNLYDSAVFIGGNTFSNDYVMGPDRLIANGNPLCEGESITVAPDYVVPGTLNYTWLKNDVPIPGYINVSNPTYTISSAGVYTLLADIGTCFVRGYLNIEYASINVVNTTIVSCDDNADGITSFNLTNANTIITGSDTNLVIEGYYQTLLDAQNQQNKITNTTTYQNTTGNTVIARVENQFGCAAYATITLQIANHTLLPIPTVSECDTDSIQDGFFAFDLPTISSQIGSTNALPSGHTILYFLNISDAINGNNALNSPFTNTIMNQQTIYARIIDGGDCYGILPVNIRISVFPSSIQNEVITICNGENTILDAGSGYTSYSWDTNPIQNTQTITVSETGNYSVTVTNSEGCTATKTYSVYVSTIATIINLSVTSFTGMNNSITVSVSGEGDYEFSLDNINYQNSNVFSNLSPGEYTVYVRDKKGCGTIQSETITVLDYPKFFTPNGDGYNDTWVINKLEEYYPNAILYIFNRYGKLLKHIRPLQEGWNGMYNNVALPSDDYWFTLSLENDRIIKGHFALKR